MFDPSTGSVNHLATVVVGLLLILCALVIDKRKTVVRYALNTLKWLLRIRLMPVTPLLVVIEMAKWLVDKLIQKRNEDQGENH